MPRRQQFYDPIMQTEPEPLKLPDVHAIRIEMPGVYVAARDVATMLRVLGEQEHGDARGPILELADYFASLNETVEEMPLERVAYIPEPPLPPASPAPVTVVNPEVALVEMFPNEDGSYWYARAVSSDGYLLKSEPVLSGVNHDEVVAQSFARWPGKEVREGPDALYDALWEEQPVPFSWNGRRRPSPRRLWP